MKCLVVVLAVASLCLAEPEADPGLFYGGLYPYGIYPYGLPYAYRGHSVYGYNFPGGFVHEERLHKREADPQFPLVAPLVPAFAAGPYAVPVAPFAPAVRVASPVVATVNTHVGQAVVVPKRFYSSHDCVTSQGCAVRVLKEHGLAKRDADADPAVLYSHYPYLYHGFGYPIFRPPIVSPVVAEVSKPVTYTHIGAHAVNPTHVVEKKSGVVGYVVTK